MKYLRIRKETEFANASYMQSSIYQLQQVKGMFKYDNEDCVTFLIDNGLKEISEISCKSNEYEILDDSTIFKLNKIKFK